MSFRPNPPTNFLSFSSIPRKTESRNLVWFRTSLRPERPSVSSVFWIKYLDCGVVGWAALGEEAEGGVEPHHVVALEAVLVGADQEGLVSIGVPPADWGQTLANRGNQGKLAGNIDNMNKGGLVMTL